MSIEEALRTIEELKGRFDAPFSSSDKNTIEKLYYEALGRTFRPTSCQQCYHDAVIEIYHFIKHNKKMAQKCKYMLRAGAIIMSTTFKNGKIFTNDNLTDSVAREYLKKYPKQAELFQKMPKSEDAKAKE